jgi:peptidylprolyl isomerase
VLIASLVLAGILIAAVAVSDSQEKSAKSPESSPASAAKPDSNSPAAEVKPSPVVVAKIGDYEITKDDLIRRLLTEIRPRSEDYAGPWKPVSPEAVLLDLVSEKATMMEGRKTGALDDPIIQSYVERQKRQKLGTKVVVDYIRQNLSVSDTEIDQMMKSNPKVTREQAGMLVQRAKGTAMLEQFYKQLLVKFHYKPSKENFAKASEIHQRLLLNPAKPRNEGWILNSQMRDDVTKEEKALVLATYDGGQVTLKDWLETLGEIVPPGRPKNLNTPDGVEKLLDRTLRSTMLVAEAKSRGYDKDPQYLREIKDLEDEQVLYKMQADKAKDTPEPNDAQISAYFEKNKEWFTEGPSLKVDQIWCQDLATARKAKEELDGGKDFPSVKEAYSLQKAQEPHDTWRGGEGPFWDDLWKGEPNQVVGPVKGYYGDGLAWRLVKIMTKTPAKERPLSQVHDPIKWTILSERRKALIDSYGKELREKYKYELYADRIQGVDPLDVTLYPQTKK